MDTDLKAKKTQNYGVRLRPAAFYLCRALNTIGIIAHKALRGGTSLWANPGISHQGA